MILFAIQSLLSRNPYKQAACLLVVLLFCGAATAHIRVSFLAPDQPGKNPFWTQTIMVMQAAADNLDIDLDVVYSKSNTYSNRKDGLALLKNKEKPDYFLTGYWSGATNDLLQEAEKQGIKTFIFNSGINAKDRNKLGGPRDKYRSWIGQMTPDDEQAGFELAGWLAKKATASGGTNQETHMIGIGGQGDSEAEHAQRSGLNSYFKDHKDAVLDTFLYAGWSQAIAYQSLSEALKTYPLASAIWSNTSTMALGGIQAARKLGKIPGKDIFVGGIGWPQQALESIAAGDMEVALGGHFLEGAWALILLYDYQYGHDFADDLGVEFHTVYLTITADNAQTYLNSDTDTNWNEVDFKRYSKTYNPGLKKYRWPLEDILKQLRTTKTHGSSHDR